MIELISHWKKNRQELTEKLGREPTEQEIAKRMNRPPGPSLAVNHAAIKTT